MDQGRLRRKRYPSGPALAQRVLHRSDQSNKWRKSQPVLVCASSSIVSFSILKRIGAEEEMYKIGSLDIKHTMKIMADIVQQAGAWHVLSRLSYVGLQKLTAASFPQRTPQSDFLRLYSRKLNTVGGGTLFSMLCLRRRQSSIGLSKRRRGSVFVLKYRAASATLPILRSNRATPGCLSNVCVPLEIV